MQQTWVSEKRRYIVYVDSYENGVLQGWLSSPHQTVERFDSLSQFLLKMEELLDEAQLPQAYTTLRRFSDLQQPDCENRMPYTCGRKMTFELQVIFRQHSSWQGVLVWREQKVEHSFRSVLELVILLDSALRSTEESGAA